MSAPHYGFTGDDDPTERDIATFEYPSQALSTGVDDGSAPVLSDEQIKSSVQFQEQWFDSVVMRGPLPEGERVEENQTCT